MKGLPPGISGTFTVDCSFIAENSIFANLLVVPVGKFKKVKTLYSHFMNFIKKCYYIPPADEGIQRWRRMRSEEGSIYHTGRLVMV